MKIQHSETVTRLVLDPNSSTGMRPATQLRRSDIASLAVPDPENPEGPAVEYARGEDGTFDVPEEVGRFFVSGTTGHGFKGWSQWTGDDQSGPVAVSALTGDGGQVAALQGQVTALTALVNQLLETHTAPAPAEQTPASTPDPKAAAKPAA